MVKRFLSRTYLGLILIFLYAPIATLVVLSFNSSKSMAQWTGFTFQWYTSLFQTDSLMNALYYTLLIAFLSSVLAVIIGTAASLAMNRMKRAPRAILMGITNIPMLNADIVTGIAFMMLFLSLNYAFGFSSILLAHITFNIPYVILSVMPKLGQTDSSTYEAALDLGASPLYAFFKVTLPEIMPGVMTGFLLAFTMSLDDFVITHFTKGPGVHTLSTKVYAELRKGIHPEIYALSSLMFVSVILLLVIVNRRSSLVSHTNHKSHKKGSKR